MKIIALLLMLAATNVAFCASNLVITAPAQYEDGSPISLSDIQRYDVCFLATPGAATCQEIRQVTGITTPIPAGAQSAKARTITIFGAISEWSEEVRTIIKKPKAPTLQVNVTTDPA